MPRYLLLSRDPKARQALDLARDAPGLRLDGIADADHVLVEGEETALAALLAAHPERLAAERIVEIVQTPAAPPLPSPFPTPPQRFPQGPSELLEPPLPSSFRFA
jgi:hypothetical protein